MSYHVITIIISYCLILLSLSVTFCVFLFIWSIGEQVIGLTAAEAHKLLNNGDGATLNKLVSNVRMKMLAVAVIEKKGEQFVLSNKKF